MKAILKIVPLGVALVFAGAVIKPSIAENPGAKDRDNSVIPGSQVKQGFEIAPVHLNLQHKNRALVGLGSYIVNAQAGCNDCHTCPSYLPGHSPYTGGDGRINA